jgi:hypothetical protein
MKRLVVLVLALALCGCARGKSHGGVEHWVIVGHASPGGAVLPESDAVKWIGRSIELGPDLAVAGPDSCRRPLYDRGPVPGDSIAQALHIPPGSLGASWPPGATVTIVETSCNGETWYSPGALLIETSPTHAFAPFEGVFFELEKR